MKYGMNVMPLEAIPRLCLSIYYMAAVRTSEVAATVATFKVGP